MSQIDTFLLGALFGGAVVLLLWWRGISRIVRELERLDASVQTALHTGLRPGESRRIVPKEPRT